MGLYDTITVHYPLPDVPDMPPEGVTLQTKSLEHFPNLDQYALTEERQLLLTVTRGYILEEPMDMDWHGDIETAEGYTIRMTEGQVTWIKRTREI